MMSESMTIISAGAFMKSDEMTDAAKSRYASLRAFSLAIKPEGMGRSGCALASMSASRKSFSVLPAAVNRKTVTMAADTAGT